MAPTIEDGRIVETAEEARQGERGPSMLYVLIVATVAVAVVYAILWYFMIY